MGRDKVKEQESLNGPGDGYATRATASVVWTVGQKWVLRITGFVTIAILARALDPSDFGVVALASSLLPFLQLLADLGFSTYLLQVEKASQRGLSTFFWYSIGAGALLTTGMVFAAPLLGTLFSTPELVPVVQGLAPVALIITLGAVPTTILRRKLRFRELALQAVVAGGIGQAIAVTLALLGFGVWALVWQALSVQVICTVLAWISAGWMPSLRFSWQEFTAMARFGGNVVAIELVALARLWVENAIVVAALGVTGLGFLNIAQRLIQIAQDLTSAALVPVSLVVFAQIRSTTDRLRSGYLRAQGVSYALVGAIMLFIVVCAPVLIPLLFGSQWPQSIVPAQLLAVAGILTIGAALDQGLFYGLGKPGRWFVYALIIDTVTVLVTAITARYGLSAIALGFVCVAAAATVVRWSLAGRELETPWWAVAGPLARTAIPIGVAAGAGFAAMYLAADVPPIVRMLLAGVVMVGVYLPALRFTARTAWNELGTLAGGLLRRLKLTRQKAVGS